MELNSLCYGCMEIKGTQKTCANCGYQQDSGPESSHHLPPGTILANKYLVGKVLGQGGFGITYVAYDFTLGAIRALCRRAKSAVCFRP